MDQTTLPAMVMQAQINVLETENLKKYQNHMDNMMQDRPKLYGLIMEHISAESKDAIKTEADYDIWQANKDPEKLWQALEKMHKVDSVSAVSEMVELVARQHYYAIKQGSYETLIQFSERFRATYKACEDNGQGSIPEKTRAMVFFHALDTIRYVELKKQLMNNWAVGARKTSKHGQ
jgi:hypothetical protein